MSYSGTQFGDISQRVGIFMVAKMLARAQIDLILERFGTRTELPKNAGQTVKFRRPVNLAASLVTLTEGVTPAPQSIEYEDVSVDVAQYGTWIGFTDVLQDTHEDPNVQVMSELSGEQAANTKELIIYNELLGGTSVIYSGTATSRATVEAPLDESDLALAQRILKGNHAKPLTKMIPPTDKVATQPVAPAYVAFGHTNLESDLRDLNGFVVRENYASYQPVVPQEIGKWQDIRFILAPHFEPFFGAGSANITGVYSSGGNVDVYPIIILGQDAFGVVPLKGMDSVKVAVKNPKMGESYEDPLGQRGFVAWKMWYAAVRLNEAWMVRIETAVAAI